jgi:hypothetical protein
LLTRFKPEAETEDKSCTAFLVTVVLDPADNTSVPSEPGSGGAHDMTSGTSLPQYSEEEVPVAPISSVIKSRRFNELKLKNKLISP